MLWDRGTNDDPNICSFGKEDIKKKVWAQEVYIPLNTETMRELRLMLGKFWVQREIYGKNSMLTNMQLEILNKTWAMEIKV